MWIFDYNDKDLEVLVRQLTNDLKNPDPEIREKAANDFSSYSRASIFGMNGEPLYKDKIDRFNELTCEIAMDSIIEGLKDENIGVKISLIWCIGNLNDERGVKPLISLLDDEGRGIRGASEYNLVNLKDHASQQLIASLNSDSKNIRRSAVFALGDIECYEAFNPLIKSLKDEDWNVRFKAIIALGKLGDEKSIEPISQCLEDKSANVRRKAAEVIGILSLGEKIPNKEEREGEAKSQREEHLQI